MKQTKFPPVKGTRDFYPEQMAFRQWLFGKMREVSQKFGYQEYEGPILESYELYAAKSSEELLKKQTFTLERDEKKLALRPELTPTLARMVAQKQEELPKPIRWFSIGPRFRYEQPQKGRFREFYQWDVDLIGSSTPESDAELIAIGAEFFKSVGLTPKEVKIKVNDRRLMEQRLSSLKIAKDKIQEVFKAIDKKEKMPEKEWQDWLKKMGLNDSQRKELETILKDRDFTNESEELSKVFSALADLGVEEYVEFDPTVVRGLDYYTGIVFEARDTDGEFRSILGGGRYDNLVEIMGGSPLPGVGFAAGDAVVEEVLKKYKKIPDLISCPAQVLVTVFDESLFQNSLKIATRLRNLNIATEIYLDPTAKLDKQLKYADQQRISYAIILGPEEAAKNEVTIKSLATGEQKRIAQALLPDDLKSE